jgi:hypothetical protein
MSRGAFFVDPFKHLFDVENRGNFTVLNCGQDGRANLIVSFDDDENEFFFERVVQKESVLASPKNSFLVEDFLEIQGGSLWIPLAKDCHKVIKALKGIPDRQTVYFAIATDCNPKLLSSHVFWFKVGCTGNPEERVRTLQCGHPNTLEILRQWNITNEDRLAMRKCERRMHSALRAYGGPFASGDAKPSGGTEWFKIDMDGSGSKRELLSARRSVIELSDDVDSIVEEFTNGIPFDWSRRVLAGPPPPAPPPAPPPGPAPAQAPDPAPAPAPAPAQAASPTDRYPDSEDDEDAAALRRRTGAVEERGPQVGQKRSSEVIDLGDDS